MEALIFLILLTIISLSASDTFSVKIGVDHHVNVVDSRFLSFTIDPKYLFSSSEKYNSKECICMATSLTPAYIRIAGPSTSSMTFQNATIAINELEEDNYQEIKSQGRLAVSHRKWRKFVQWAKSTGFDLVFALNNEEKTSSGMWDPNTALNILTVAEKANIADIFWQLGYECNDQSIEEYLNDLETLRVIIETFAPGRAGEWLVVGGDVSNCLHADSKSDFKDYITLSDDMMDAIMLNGNNFIWWLSILKFSNYPSYNLHLIVHQFWCTLLYKNLVGEKVLDVELESDQSVLFAHCTSLRHKAVPGAVTIYGANMDDEVARFSIKMNKREEGGDIMQFVISQDHNGNVIVNGRPMLHEGDIKPAVKRVRPYKTLLINLPPKSFGFWVLANTNIEACQYFDGTNDTSEPESHHDSEEESEEIIRRKRLVEFQKSQYEKKEMTVKKTDIVTSFNSVMDSGVSKEPQTVANKCIQNLENNEINCNSVKNKLVNNSNDSRKSNIETSTPMGILMENNLVINDVIDLDNITELEIIRDDDNKLKENISELQNDLGVTLQFFHDNSVKTKRNADDKDTTRTDTDNAASSSISNSSRKPKRPEEKSKRRQSLNNPEGKRFENIKISKLRRSEDSKPNKLERLKAKVFKNNLLEGKNNILDNILSKRNERLKSERRKLRFGNNKLSKRNSRTAKVRNLSKNNFNEDKGKRIRRSINKHILKPTDLFLNNSNEIIITTDNESRSVRNANVEHKTNRNYRKLSTADEDIYITGQSADKPIDNIRRKTLRSGRNVHDLTKNQSRFENHTDSSKSGTETRSNEEVISQKRPNQRNIENKDIISSEDVKLPSHRNKISRSSRNVIEKGIKHSESFSENEIENDDIEKTKLWKILRKIHKQLKDLSTERDTDYDAFNDEITIDDDANTSKEDSGLIKSTVNNLLRVLRELNKNLSRFWSGVNLLD
ncbi:hypothetical protein K1T71_013440 [Dendrolimus kikuchii]|uniref:Uncharacterized protein n=1 Tax=Dendrolimus kikuchii TaxID=765133 RepID=A0ACC1CGN1_9NEOP|nr:hypothetical protein K1T71_013440 [Dendrolimus kikuchii]